MPARGQLFLVEVNDFHLGLLPNELAGVHERAVPRVSQAICCADLFPVFAPGKESTRSCGILGAPDGVYRGVDLEASQTNISRSGNKQPIKGLIIRNIPDREISLAQSPVVTDDFPNGKLSKP